MEERSCWRCCIPPPRLPSSSTPSSTSWTPSGIRRTPSHISTPFGSLTVPPPSNAHVQFVRAFCCPVVVRGGGGGDDDDDDDDEEEEQAEEGRGAHSGIPTQGTKGPFFQALLSMLQGEAAGDCPRG
eukprot:762808-Hanusia_phi.AAC.2